MYAHPPNDTVGRGGSGGVGISIPQPQVVKVPARLKSLVFTSARAKQSGFSSTRAGRNVLPRRAKDPLPQLLSGYMGNRETLAGV